MITEKPFRKERRRLQAKHLWMEVKLSWNVLSDRMYTVAPTGKSREQLYALLFNKAARGSQKNPYEEKAYRGPAHKEVQAWWEQCQEWMLYYKCQCAPLVQDIKGFLHAFRGQGRGCSCGGGCICGILRKEVANRGAICFTFFASFHWPVLWVLGCVVFGCLVCLVCFGVLKTPSFLFSPVLQHVGIAYLRQNVLMTV